MTSAMSARMSRRVTADSSERAARTMVPRLTDEHGSSANSDEAIRIVSPARRKGENYTDEDNKIIFMLKLHIITCVCVNICRCVI